MSKKTDKELVWKKLSTVPQPDWIEMISDPPPRLLSLRFSLKRYMGYTDAEIDEVIEEYK